MTLVMNSTAHAQKGFDLQKRDENGAPVVSPEGRRSF